MRLRVLPYMSKALSSNGKRAFLASDCSDFVVGEEVKHALVNRIPVVALESTIISHGMPYPKNLETALRIEDEIRKQGAIPATIAVIDGNVKVGLTLEELKLLAQASSVIKASRRDLAYAATLKATAGTTVASTMFIAHRAGLAGGIKCI
jgi:pseudouridine-5'-phosphate glycosidase